MYPDLVLVVVCGRDQCCLSVRLRVCYMFVLCLVRCAEETKSPKASDRVATRREQRESLILQLNNEDCIATDDLYMQ